MNFRIYDIIYTQELRLGLHRSVTYSFLPVGHTKFSPDWCFGLIKQKLRKTRVDCLQDLVNVVNTSAEVNHSQLVGTQNGDVVVPTYNWSGQEHYHRTSEDCQTSKDGITLELS